MTSDIPELILPELLQATEVKPETPEERAARRGPILTEEMYLGGGPRPRDGVRIRDEDGPFEVDMAEAYGATVPDDGCWRAEQYLTSGRWRRRKQVVRQLAADLGWPGCLEVAHDDQIVGAVLQAGVRLRDWRRFERSGRRMQEHLRTQRAWRRARRRVHRKASTTGEPPF